MSSNKKVVRIKKKNSPTIGNSVLKYGGLTIVSLALVSLIFSSVFSGLGRTQRSLTFGRFGNKNIVYKYNNAFGQAVENELQRLEGNEGLDPRFYDFMRRLAWNNAYSTIVTRTAIAFWMEKSGYVPSSRAIAQKIIDSGSFQTNGKFDQRKYRDAPASTKESLNEFYTAQIIVDTWASDVFYGINRSAAQIDFLAQMKMDVKTLEYTTIPFSDYPEEDVIAYGKENIRYFQSRDLSRITVENESTATQVSEEYNAKKDMDDAFGTLVGQYSTDFYKDKKGNVGSMTFHEVADLITEESAQEIFSIAEGDIAGPYETQFGWIIFRADSQVVELDIEQSVEEVRNYMLENDAGIIEDKLITRASELRELALNMQDFRTAMQEQGLQVKTTNPFPLNYANDPLLGETADNADHPELSGTSSSDEFWNNIAQLNRVGEVSAPVIISNSIGIFALLESQTTEYPEYWDDVVNSELSQILQTEFNEVVLSDNSKLFKDNFSKIYAHLYPPIEVDLNESSQAGGN